MTDRGRRAISLAVFLLIFAFSAWLLVRSESGRLESRVTHRVTHEVERVNRERVAQPVVVARCLNRPLSSRQIRRIVRHELRARRARKGSPGNSHRGLPGGGR